MKQEKSPIFVPYTTITPALYHQSVMATPISTTGVADDNGRESTPTKARIQGTIEYLKSQGITGHNEDVFRFNGVSHATGYRILAGNSRTSPSDSPKQETRGRKHKITPEQIRQMEQVLETESMKGRTLTWKQMGTEAGVEGCTRTIKNAIGSMDYYQCVACQRGWQSPASAKNRVEYATMMLLKYREPEDWDRIRFSGEVEFGYSPQHQLRMMRKPGQRYCLDCIQYCDSPDIKDEKVLQGWTAIGTNFKSPIIFNELPSKSNGKMSLQPYIDRILEPVVKPWIQAGHDFILEEDGDSEPGKGRNNNIVRKWKTENRLEYFFGCASSPDLSPTANCWQPQTQQLKRYSRWDDATAKLTVMEGWESTSQNYINERIRSMPERLREVIARGGQMVDW